MDLRLDLDTPRVYVGIGEPDAPRSLLEEIERFAQVFAEHRWVLRSGLAHGPDQAFHRGAIQGGGRYELYLPWREFERGARGRTGKNLVMERPTLPAYQLAQTFHADWSKVRPKARPLLARYSHEILGKDLDDPADLVICWTSNHSVDGDKPTGGTGQALRLAVAKDIPVLNIARPDHLEVVRRLTRQVTG